MTERHIQTDRYKERRKRRKRERKEEKKEKGRRWQILARLWRKQDFFSCWMEAQIDT